MGFELAADHLDDLHGIAEAVAGAVEGDEAVAAADVVEEGLFLRGCDGVDVGVDHEGVVVPEGVRIEVIGAGGVGEIDAEGPEPLEELWEAFGGFVVAVVAEDEDFEDDQVILARLKAITSSNSLTVSVADLLS